MELQRELNLLVVDIAIIPETKKKLKDLTELADYMLIYNGVTGGKRAAAGVAKMIQKRLKNRIHSYQFVNEHILTVRYKTIREYTALVAVYSPEAVSYTHLDVYKRQALVQRLVCQL